jgi:hypothetical protein
MRSFLTSCGFLWLLFTIPWEFSGKKSYSLGIFPGNLARLKGVLIMTTVPFTQCCSMLAVDPKTLRQWLKPAHLSVHTHPTDARIKCLTIEQVQQLAALHHRSIKQDAAPASEQMVTPAPLLQRFEKPTQIPLESLATSVPSASQLPPTRLSDSDLVKSLFSLQATVADLQQQVTGLALELLQERTLSYEQRLHTFEVLIHSTEGQPVMPQARQTMGQQTHQEKAPSKEQDLHPTERRTRPSLLPLIEYGACGTYVVICPQEGELLLTPDSPEWFDWLATLSSFRFVGQQGRLSTYRNQGRSYWMAYRRIQCRRYEYALGATSRLTIGHLERMAATLQSHVSSL